MKIALAKSLFHSAVLCTFSGLLVSVSAAPLSFRITDLGGGSPAAINDLGHVVIDGAPSVWSSQTGAVALTKCGAGPFGQVCYDSVAALGINNRGQVVGYGSNFNGNVNDDRISALRWDRPDTMVLLPNVIGTHRQAVAISNSGVAVGGATGGHNSFPIYWDKDAQLIPGTFDSRGGFQLPVVGTSPISGPLGGANAINNADVIVGFSSPNNSLWYNATLWRAGAAQDLGLLTGDLYSIANAINSKDIVVGTSVRLDCDGGCAYSSRAFLWSAASGMLDLNTGEGAASTAAAINDDDWVVGTFGPAVQGTDSKGDKAALWRPHGEAEDLNTLVDLSHSTFSKLTQAVDINAWGEIVGTGRGRDGFLHGFLLTPIPEMQTWGCTLVGLALLILSLRGRLSRIRD